MKLLRECFSLLLIAAVPALLAAWLHPKRPAWSWTRPDVRQVNLEDASGWTSPVLWVDARSSGAFRERHIPGAILLNEEEWESRLPVLIAAWDADAKVIVYCDNDGCDASRSVARRLRRELAVTNVYVLKGGWTAWTSRQN